MSRIMGIDLGERRVGVALSDPLGLTAQPHTVLDRDSALSELARIAIDESVEKIVVGMPLDLRGREGHAARAMREDAAEIAGSLGLPFELWDERLTTVSAERVLTAHGMRRQKRREVIDKVAAAVMLQSYLDSQRSQ